MLEVVIKQQLAGDFSSGTEVAYSTAIRSNQPPMSPSDGQAAHRDKGAEEIAMRKWNADLSAVARRAKAERGMSLVEATIILMVLAILTAVIAPSASDYISDARSTKAKEDVEAIGMSVARALRDTGSACLREAGTTACTEANRVDLLHSNVGNDPKSVTGADFDPSALATPDQLMNWLGATNAVAAAGRDTIEDQLITNAADYADVTFTTGSLNSRGWRGAYLPESGPDPWGFKYQVNSIFLAVATDTTAGTSEGQASGGWHKDVLVVSPGFDGIVQTAFGSNAQNAQADDVIFVLRGSTK